MARTPKTPAEPAEKTAFTVLLPLNHNGDDYAPGELVEMTAAEAAALLGCAPPVVSKPTE